MSVTKFEVGKWYRYVLKEKSDNWNIHMDIMLDGEPRKCTEMGLESVGGCRLSFDGVTGWWWWDKKWLDEVPAPTPDIMEYEGEKWRRLGQDEKLEVGDRMKGYDCLTLSWVISRESVGKTPKDIGAGAFAWRKLIPSYVPPAGWRLVGRDEKLTDKCHIKWFNNQRVFPVAISTGKTIAEINAIDKTDKVEYAICPITEEPEGEERNCHNCKHEKVSAMGELCGHCFSKSKWEPKTGSEGKMPFDYGFVKEDETDYPIKPYSTEKKYPSRSAIRAKVLGLIKS
jgi:hypothetical protein